MNNNNNESDEKLAQIQIKGDIGDGMKNYLYSFNRPSLNQKKAVFELMKEHGIDYAGHKEMRGEFITHQKDLSQVNQKSMEYFLKVQEIEFTTDFLSQLFAIWAQRPGTSARGSRRCTCISEGRVFLRCRKSRT